MARALVRVKTGSGGSDSFDDAISVNAVDRSIVVDLSKLPSPDRVYDADYAWVRHRPGRVSLFFGKANIDAPEEPLRSRVELRYGPDHFLRNFWRNSDKFRQAVHLQAARWPPDQERESVQPETLRAERDHSQWVNFEYMARVGTEAALDFYHLPASGIAKYATGHGSAGLKVVPAMRVQLTIQELSRLFRACEPMVEQIAAYIPPDEEDDASPEASVLTEEKN